MSETDDTALVRWERDGVEERIPAPRLTWVRRRDGWVDRWPVGELDDLDRGVAYIAGRRRGPEAAVVLALGARPVWCCSDESGTQAHYAAESAQEAAQEYVATGDWGDDPDAPRSTTTHTIAVVQTGEDYGETRTPAPPGAPAGVRRVRPRPERPDLRPAGAGAVRGLHHRDRAAPAALTMTGAGAAAAAPAWAMVPRWRQT